MGEREAVTPLVFPCRVYAGRGSVSLNHKTEEFVIRVNGRVVARVEEVKRRVRGPLKWIIGSMVDGEERTPVVYVLCLGGDDA